MKRPILSFAFLIIAVGMSAQEDPAKEFIQNQIKAIGMEEMYFEVASQVAIQFQAEIQPALGRALSENEKQRLLLFWLKKVQEFMPLETIEDIFIPVIRKYLSLNEILEINRFFSTPIGRKYLAISPIMIKEAKGAGEELGLKIADVNMVASLLQDLKKEFPTWFPE